MSWATVFWPAKHTLQTDTIRRQLFILGDDFKNMDDISQTYTKTYTTTTRIQPREKLRNQARNHAEKHISIIAHTAVKQV